MRLRLYRNATMRLVYGGGVFLTDPYFAPRHSRPSYAGKVPSPLVDLPCSVGVILEGVEAILLSHLHSDHFDPAAEAVLPRRLPLFCQGCDEASLRQKGFTDVRSVEEGLEWRGVAIRRTGGAHGSGAVLDEMGRVSGFTFECPGEPRLYWAGDSVLNDEVRDTISRFKPDLVITHSCGAKWAKDTLIVMDASQTLETVRLSAPALVVAVHMEAVDHGTVSRAMLRAAADAAGISPDRLIIPADGEELEFMPE